MKFTLYPKLAWIGIQKNRRLYFPYLLTCAAMVMMQYIILSLKESSMLQSMSVGQNAAAMLGIGSAVITIFSVVFLFYTHSFLIRRRKKEFGLYNILGMTKVNIARILLWESVYTFLFAVLVGLGAGILLSKLAELSLVRILGGAVSYTFVVSASAIWQSLLLYLPIFILIDLYTLGSIRISNPIALLHSENTGEKAPRANWVLGVFGFLVLGAAYAIAVTIKAPLEAMTFYFIAVLLVILGTYLLFIAGSVMLCRILQKNKKYYYQPNHFVSVSSMVYRMKRNGAGLASICILSTMVLVMISTTSCLYFGAEDSLRTQYPRDLMVEVRLTGDTQERQTTANTIRDAVTEELSKRSVATGNVIDRRVTTIYGVLDNGVFRWNPYQINNLDILCLKIRPISDSPEIAASYPDLAPGEAVVYPVRFTPEFETMTLEKFGGFTIRDTIHHFDSEEKEKTLTPMLEVFVPDYERFASLAAAEENLYPTWIYGVDLEVSEEEKAEICDTVRDVVWQLPSENLSYLSCMISSRAENSSDFYGIYGGLFFLGILLSIVFLLATVLILYYKQISEGYEDQNRFAIMQKVGMTKREIQRSINSQMLLIFLLPLVMSALHLVFNFPITRKLLLLFGLDNVGLFVATTTVSFVIFTLFYLLTYRITSNAYYAIVSDAKEKT